MVTERLSIRLLPVGDKKTMESPWKGARRFFFSPEETGETFRLRDDEGESFAERVLCDSGELP
jgi:hypothetical protein